MSAAVSNEEGHLADSVTSPGCDRWWLLALAGIFSLLTWWTWRKWTDAQVDFGLQLYTPWQLSEGKVLYRDISYIAGGPLSQYFNALLFRIFGVHYIVIAVANLVIAALLTWGVFRLFARAAGALTAFVIGVVMLCVFVFGHLHYIGNYNFVTPYTCETTHGVALSVLGIGLLLRWLETSRAKYLLAAGLAAGGVFLTKPEVFVALAGALVWALALRAATPSKVARSCYLALLGGIILPGALFALYFAVVWSPGAALGAAAGAWTPLLSGRAGHGKYYDWCLGLDHRGENFFQIVQYTGATVLVLGALAMGARFFQRGNRLGAGMVWAGLAAFLFSPANRLTWIQSGRVLPLLTLFGAGFIGWTYCRRRGEVAARALLLPSLWSVFALLLLAKMGLFPRVWHYGYYLALPAAVFCVYLLVWLLPRELARFEVNSQWFRAGVLVLLSAGVIQLLRVSDSHYSPKTFQLGGAEGIQTYPEAYIAQVDDDAARAEAVQLAVAWVVSNTPPTSTLLVLPEGSMINYLTRRRNPTPYVVAGPHELQVAGEATVLAAYAANPPDFVLLSHRSAAEFGVDNFGKDARYGLAILQWVQANYTSVWQVGHEPFQTNAFGMKMLERKRH